MQKTPIEYLTHTWNPIAMRCTPVSEGCKNCWHLRMAHRMADNPTISERRRVAYAGGSPWLDPYELSAPLRSRKPANIGVQFMGDLFHRSITNEQIAAVFGVMAATPQHSYYLLTKRVEEMANWCTWESCASKRAELTDNVFVKAAARKIITTMPICDGQRVNEWPLPNVTLGVSVDNQKTSYERLYHLYQIPAARYMVSCEPLLEFIDLGRDCTKIDWVVAGAETGPGARHMDLNWARHVRDQCRDAGVPFFFKVDSNGSRKLDRRMYEELPND